MSHNDDHHGGGHGPGAEVGLVVIVLVGLFVTKGLPFAADHFAHAIHHALSGAGLPFLGSSVLAFAVPRHCRRHTADTAANGREPR